MIQQIDVRRAAAALGVALASAAAVFGLGTVADTVSALRHAEPAQSRQVCTPDVYADRLAAPARQAAR